MRQFETLLRSLIREQLLLNEAALTPSDLMSLGDVDVVAKCLKSNGNVNIYITNKDSGEVERAAEIRFEKPYYNLQAGGPCSKAWEVTWSSARVKGLGPLIYDIAMEILSLKGLSLASDRDEVSDKAQKIWDFYDTERGDVEKIQLDNEDGDLTPDYPDDDCNQFMSRSVSADSGGSKKWNDVSLSRAFMKKSTPILDELNSLGILDLKIK